jgi:hypothetical protein
MARIHFWTLREEAQKSWSPDDEPDRHQDAYGHAFLELYWRLRAKGADVSIGPRVPRNTRAVVVSLEELTEWEGQARAGKVFRLGTALVGLPRPPSVAVLRVDMPLDVASPAVTTLELMPTRASIERPGQAHLPMLAQRGMTPRDVRRGDKIETVVLKSYSANVPAWLDAHFERQVHELGCTLRIDTERENRWRDFLEIDVVLCTHDAASLGDPRRKPATKLLNAWGAGAIPICGSHPGYLELGQPGDTMLVADTPREFLAAIAALRSDPSLVKHLRQQIQVRAQSFDRDSVVDAYECTFVGAPRASRTAIAWSMATALVASTRARLTPPR